MRRGSRCGLVLLASLTSAPAQTPAPPDSLGRLIDLAGLPLLTPGVVCRQFASTDPSGRGEDHGHFLRRAGDTCVLAEMQGPGVVVRLWSANPAGRLRVYLDGESAPRLDAPFQDLFTGELPPFVAPIATHASGGWISYWPIPYAKSCRVEVSDLTDPRALYYHVQYLTYPAGTPMRTFTRELPASEQRELERVLRAWRTPGASPILPTADDREARTQATLAPGASRDLFACAQPGTIVTLRLDVEPRTPDALRGLQLIAAWDGAAPSVLVPAGDFFGCGFGATPFRGLALGWDDHGGYCHLPMPFQRGARIAVRNAGSAPVTVAARMQLRAAAPAPDAGSLHAEFRAVDGVGDERYELAAIEGPGKFVGVTQALQGVGDLWYLEGNEELFVDGEAKPSILGTGTEDFYNGGWYWDRGTFAQPLHGLGVKQEWTTNRTTPWRLQVPDAVPFARQLVARIEHGSRNAVRDGYYSSVAFWYGPVRAVRAVADAAMRVPRLWAFRPRGFVGASALRWADQPAIVLRAWEDLTQTHRGLPRPLFQAFPESHVQHEAAAVDARLVVLADGADGADRAWRARFMVPAADRYRVELRLLASGELPRIQLDGREVTLQGDDPPERAPLRLRTIEAGGLAAGEHELAFIVSPGTRAPLAFDALRLVHASPFVRTWCVGPPVAARRDGTVEDVMPEEARFLAADFDPRAAGWEEVAAAGDSLDLNQAVSAQSPVLAYLMLFVHSPAARTARVLLGSDDGVRLWVDGELRWSRAVHRHLSADEDRFDVPLRAGWNRILVKVKNDDGGFGVMLRIADAEGTLRFAAAPR